MGDFKVAACGSLWKLSCWLSQPFVRTNLAVPWQISLGTGILWVSRRRGLFVLFSGGGGVDNWVVAVRLAASVGLGLGSWAGLCSFRCLWAWPFGCYWALSHLGFFLTILGFSSPFAQLDVP